MLVAVQALTAPLKERVVSEALDAAEKLGDKTLKKQIMVARLVHSTYAATIYLEKRWLKRGLDDTWVDLYSALNVRIKDLEQAIGRKGDYKELFAVLDSDENNLTTLDGMVPDHSEWADKVMDYARETAQKIANV